jgi:hypothetical protein
MHLTMALVCSVMSISWKSPLQEETVVAPGRGFLSEIVEHGHAQAGGGGAVMLHGAEFAPVVLLHFLQFFCGRLVLVLQQEFLDDHILGRVEQDALGRFAVPSGPPGFLVVVLQAGGHVVMEHIAHVGLVDAHAESVGGDDHQGPVIQEIFLGLLPFLLAEPGMVPTHGKALAPEPGIQFIHVLPGGTIDDTAVLRMALQIVQHEFVLAAGPFHSEIQVGPVKAGDQALGILQLQALEDVFLDLLGGCGGG